MMPRIVYIAGAKHCGKTSTACALSALTGGALFDTDAVIMEETRKTAREHYTAGSLQEAEKTALLSILDRIKKTCYTGFVTVSLGGGIIDNEAAWRIVKETPDSFIAYLEVSARAAWERIGKDGGGLPPFLQVDNGEDAHRTLHERRGALYREAADIVIDAEGKAREAVAREILARLPPTE